MRHTPRRATRRWTAAVTIAGALLVAGCGGDDGDDDAAGPIAAAADEDAADSSDVSADGAERPDYGLVGPEEAAALAAAGVTVIDVRTPEEYAEGHIDGAQLIDFYDTTFGEQIADLDPGDEYLVYCRSGNRSGQAVALMEELGIERVWDLDGGVVAYGDAGLPLVR